MRTPTTPLEWAILAIIIATAVTFAALAYATRRK
jgi:hypothetical protein